jgi:hypothetical protein
LFFLAKLSLTSAAAAQTADTSYSTDVTVDQMIDLEDTDALRGEQASEYIEALRARPIDINTARVPTLSRIPSVSALDAQRIVAHRVRHGAFEHLTDLLDVNGLSRDDYLALRPFITIRATKHLAKRAAERRRSGRESWAEALRDPDIRVSYQWGRQVDLGRGYRPDSVSRGSSRYAGGPARHVARARADFGDRLAVAGALDKDPGEAWRWQIADKQPGFDHVAGSVAASHIGPVRTAILGDYTVSSGHGIGLWRGMAFGKGQDPTSGVIRSGRGIAPFASTEENRFFRGAAVSVDLQRLGQPVAPTYAAKESFDASAYGFLSRRRLDAGLEVHPETGTPVISSLRAGGLHRTQAEVQTRDAVREHAIGGGLDVEAIIGAVHTSFGGAFFSTGLSTPLARPERTDEAFDRRGASMDVASMYASAHWRELLLTGEIARMTDQATESGRPTGSDHRFAGVAALAYDDGRRVDAVVHVRHFGRGYDNPYVAAFSETAAKNERGVYAGMRAQVLPGLHLGGYIDQYAFSWLRYNVARPTTGRDARLVVEHEPRPWIELIVQVRSETKEQNGSGAFAQRGTLSSPVQVQPVLRETRQSVRWNADVEISPRFGVSTRVEGTRVWADGGPMQYGWLIAQDVEWQLHPRLAVFGRLSMFETDGFAARVYAYERDVRYAFRVPALFGRGERSYVMIRADLGRGATLEAKYGVTRFDDRDRVGSGLNELQSNRRREIRAQIRWRF